MKTPSERDVPLERGTSIELLDRSNSITVNSVSQHFILCAGTYSDGNRSTVIFCKFVYVFVFGLKKSQP